MAEGRLLKKTIASDRRVAQLTYPSALLYVFTIPHLDVEGRILGLPAHIRGTALPELAHRRPSDWTDHNVAAYMLEWTTTLDDLGQTDPLVLWYAQDGLSVCLFRGFAKNQRLRRDREAPSRLPAPPPELLEQPALASEGRTYANSWSRPVANSEVEGKDSLSAEAGPPARARETAGKPLQVEQAQETLAARSELLAGELGSRPAGSPRLPVYDLKLLAGSLRGSDERTVLTLRKYERGGCGEREFAMAAESLERRRAADGKPPLVSEARFFVAELARLLRERQETAAA